MQGDSATSLTLPSEVWNPVFTPFRDWMTPATEAPLEYIFASAYSFVGTAIGRNVFVQMGRRLFANSLIGLIGPAADKKGTPFALISGEVVPLFDLKKCDLQIVRGTGSAEGLLEQFMDQVEEEDDYGKMHKVLKAVPERRVVTIEEELGYFLVKAHSDATANLREITCQLWDGVDVSPPTRSRKLNVERPFYSMLAMTTQETLEARLEEDDILSGLLPRFIFFRGTPRQCIPWPDQPDKAMAKALAQELDKIREHAEGLRKSGHECIEPVPAARAVWERNYPLLRDKAFKAPTPAIGRMLARIEVHIIKAALVYAVSAGHSAIEEDDLRRALAIGAYLSRTAIEVAGTQMGNDLQRIEHKMLTFLEQTPAEWVKVRDLQQRLSGRVDADKFHKALRALIKLDRLECQGDADRPKMVRISK